MIHYEKFTLDNGLQVIVHEDNSVNSVVLNVLYDVGSRDEQADKTGFAHLFEHLMFGGSVNVPSFDQPLQAVGAQNNAFTSTDLTNYYEVVPANNKETAFWVESDRMLSLNFDPKVLEVQRKVVIEEFKQRYLNQPYGNTWHLIREMAYKAHSYKWPTIGESIKQIEDATMEDVRRFYQKHYNPSNAWLVLAGNISVAEAKQLSQKWFGPIPGGEKPIRKIPVEPVQTAKRTKVVKEKVPLNAIYKCWHMPARTDKDYVPSDLVSDVLGRDHSSRLYRSLVQEKGVFNSINAYVTGSLDPGLLCISGRLKPGISTEEGEKYIDEEIHKLLNDGIQADEVDKVKNQAISGLAFEDIELFNRAFKLAYCSLMGDTELYNAQAQEIEQVTLADIERCAKNILKEENANVLHYQAIQE